MSEFSRPEFKLSIDIGGTFTDLVLLNVNSGETYLGKLLSTPKDLSRGVIDIFKRVIEQNRILPEQIVGAIHGTTVATNAIIERKGAKTGLLTTKGFRDTLEIRREVRYDLYDLFIEVPEPLVPRYLRLEVAERVDKKGNIIIPVEPDSIADAITVFKNENVEAVAICFIHAYSNPAHEAIVAELVRDRYPAASVSISSEVACEIREFERTSTTVANAYLQPIMGGYLGKLDEGLRDSGYRGQLFIMMSNGGISSLDTAKKFPVRLVESGPAAGALAACYFGNLIKEDEVLSFDMGGTTAKMCIIHHGEPILANEFESARVHRFKREAAFP